MQARNGKKSRKGIVLCLPVFFMCQAAWGAQTWRYLEAQVAVSEQDTFQHDSDHLEWVQDQHELRTKMTTHLVSDYHLFDGLRIPGVEDGVVQADYRGRYDSVYQIREHYATKLYPQAGLRGNFMYPEGNDIRELFFDLRFGKVGPGNLSARLGKQQVVWGEADLFRSLDVVNPLRLDQNFLLGQNFDDIRRPLDMAKFLYDVGQVGPVANIGIEGLWTPRQRAMTEDAIVEEGFGIPFDPNNPNRSSRLPYRITRHPWSLSRVGPGKTEVPDHTFLGPVNVDLIFLADDQKPHGTALDDPEAGIRFLGSLFGADFTLNYLFKRAELPGTGIVYSSLFNPNGQLRLLPKDASVGEPECLAGTPTIFRFRDGHSIRGYPGASLTACLPVFFWYPQTHIIGGTITYNEAQYTGLIFRTEQSLSTNEPRNRLPALVGPRAGQLPNAQDFATQNTDHTRVWRSMIGFDWLRAFPWMPITRHDQWLLSMQWLLEYYSNPGEMVLLDAPFQQPHRWNNVFTFLGTGFFLNGNLRPTIAAGYDVNAQFPLLWLQGEYHLTPRVTARVGTIQYMGSQYSNSHLFLQKFADRDTTYIRLVYYLM